MMIPEHLKKWTRPKDYMGAQWLDFYVFLGRNRDSDTLTRSNFECGLEEVKAVASKDSIPNNPDDMATVQVITENHWAVGWVEWIGIHESDTTALECADKLMGRLENYPVLNEEHFSNLEMEEANQTF